MWYHTRVYTCVLERNLLFCITITKFMNNYSISLFATLLISIMTSSPQTLSPCPDDDWYVTLESLVEKNDWNGIYEHTSPYKNCESHEHGMKMISLWERHNLTVGEAEQKIVDATIGLWSTVRTILFWMVVIFLSVICLGAAIILFQPKK